jgi:quinol monooxygenase YgiN
MKNTEIIGIARLEIIPGKLEEFKRLNARCIELVLEKDKGTLQYDFFFNSDETECLAIERYKDSDALIQHFSNMGELMTTMFETCTGSGEICGPISTQLQKMLSDTPVQLFWPYKLTKL